MDANKADALRAIGYKVGDCCGLCVFGTFPNDDWGTCDQFDYLHEKHGNRRALSINKAGWCSNFQADPQRVGNLGGFQEFREG